LLLLLLDSNRNKSKQHWMPSVTSPRNRNSDCSYLLTRIHSLKAFIFPHGFHEKLSAKSYLTIFRVVLRSNSTRSMPLPLVNDFKGKAQQNFHHHANFQKELFMSAESKEEATTTTTMMMMTMKKEPLKRMSSA